METYNLFLDDLRTLEETFEYTHDADYLNLKWVIVRSYNEFVKLVEDEFKKGNFISLISLDHDLGDIHYEHTIGNIPYDDFDEKTGYHCAKWLVDFCIDNNLKLPKFKVHSWNPVGKKNITELLNNFKKHQENNV